VASAGIDGAALDLEVEVPALRRQRQTHRRAYRAPAHDANGEGGCIVLNASVAGYRRRDFADYNASRGGAVLLARSLARDASRRAGPSRSTRTAGANTRHSTIRDAAASSGIHSAGSRAGRDRHTWRSSSTTPP
jgi:NAD(P)-dependent dehydrogenase (short-subunit alcohol dehydrogenase family)